MCKRAMSDGEPVYFVRVGYEGHWYYKFGYRSIVPACQRCKANPPAKGEHLFERFFSAQPCCHCGRPVFVDRHRKGLRYFVCSESCRRKAALQARRPEPKLRPCIICGQTFTAKRKDAFLCSAACKQKAYRRREASFARQTLSS